MSRTWAQFIQAEITLVDDEYFPRWCDRHYGSGWRELAATKTAKAAERLLERSIRRRLFPGCKGWIIVQKEL